MFVSDAAPGSCKHLFLFSQYDTYLLILESETKDVFSLKWDILMPHVGQNGQTVIQEKRSDCIGIVSAAKAGLFLIVFHIFTLCCSPFYHHHYHS